MIGMERTSGIWAPLTSSAFLYTFFQNLLGAHKARLAIAKEYLRVEPGSKFLDVGCGPADILSYLPSVIYWGVDHNDEYIEKARAKYGSRGIFATADVGDPILAEQGEFDVVHGGGLLHHLDDSTCNDLFIKVRRRLKPGARAIFVDPTSLPAQHVVARYLISLDRGLHVREPEEYAALARSVFSNVETIVRKDLLRIPYAHCITICRNG